MGEFLECPLCIDNNYRVIRKADGEILNEPLWYVLSLAGNNTEKTIAQ